MPQKFKITCVGDPLSCRTYLTTSKNVVRSSGVSIARVTKLKNDCDVFIYNDDDTGTSHSCCMFCGEIWDDNGHIFNDPQHREPQVKNKHFLTRKEIKIKDSNRHYGWCALRKKKFPQPLSKSNIQTRSRTESKLDEKVVTITATQTQSVNKLKRKRKVNVLGKTFTCPKCFVPLPSNNSNKCPQKECNWKKRKKRR